MAIRTRIAFLLCGACGLMPCEVRAATYTWTGASSSDYFNTNNWSPAGLPGSNDVVNFSTSTINFTAPVTFVGQFNWSSGTLTGQPLTLASNSVLNLSGGSKFLHTALTNFGTVNWTGGQLQVDYSSAASQYGLIYNRPGALWDIQIAATLNSAYSVGAFFANAGIVRRSSGGGNATTIAIPFLNTGTVTNAQGTINFTAGGMIEGAYSVAAGATINFSGGPLVYTNPPVLSGSGTIQMTGGTLTLTNTIIPNLSLAGGTITLSPNFQGGAITNLTMTGGTLSGNNVVSGTLGIAATLPGSLTLLTGATVTWSGGTILGPVNVASGAVLNITGGPAKQLWGALTNAGTVTWSGGGNLEVDYSTAASALGLIQNLAGALFDIQNNAAMLNGYANGAYFRNAGTVRKSATAGGTTMIAIPFHNAGTVTALQGTIQFNNGGTLGGAFSAATGAANRFNGGAFTYNTPPTLTGPGTNQITGGTLTLVSNTIPNLQLAGGTITLGPNFQGGTIANLTLLGGTLQGDNVVSGTLTIAAALPGSLTLLNGATVTWSGGSIQGPVNIAAGAVLNITGSPAKSLWGELVNAGTVTWSGVGNLNVDYSSAASQFGLIKNLAGALWDIQGSARILNAAPNGAYFQNAGTVQKSDAGTTTISIPFLNSGAVTLQQGAITFNGGVVIEGAFSAASGTTINFAGGPLTYSIPPTISGAGTVQMTAGSLTLNNTTIPNLQHAGGMLSLAPGFQGGTITNLTVSAGTVLGNNAVSGTFTNGANLPGSLALLSGADVNWSAGSIQGPVNIAAGAALTISGSATKFLWRALTNAGTVTWTGSGDLHVDYSTVAGQFGLIYNLPGALWDAQNSQRMFNAAPNSAFFHNAGTFQKSADTGTTQVSIPFTNVGTAKSLQGLLTFNGGLSLAGGTLVSGLGSTTTYGRFSIPGSAILTGALEVIFNGDYGPALSNTFTLVTYGSRTGTFAPFSVPPVAQWLTNYGATTLTLTVAQVRRLVLLASPGATNAGAVLSPLTVEVRDWITGIPIATNGLPVTVTLTSGNGVLSGNVTRTTDANGRATFNDLSINLVGFKMLSASAPGVSGVATASFQINPAAPAQLIFATPIGPRQPNGAVFQPAAAVQVQDAFGNVVQNSTATITARVVPGTPGILAGTTAVNANGTSGLATFSNLKYSLANPLASETITVYFTSPGLTPVTNNPVFVNFIFGLITLQDRNSILRINPTSPDGVFSWSVDGVERLYQQWFWLRQGASGGQSSFDTLGLPLGVSLSSSNATVNYIGAGLNVNVGFVLQGGAPGSASSDVAQTLSLQNTSGSAITLHVFQYADFDVGGDSILFPTANSVVQDGGNATMTEVVQSPIPTAWEASFYPLTLNKIAGSAPATLAGTITPPSIGDHTFGYQWSAVLSAGQTLNIALTQSIRIEAALPTAVALRIEQAGPNVIISWPTNGSSSFQLRSAGVLGSGGVWTAVTNPPVIVGPEYQVAVPRTGAVQYYRLQQ